MKIVKTVDIIVEHESNILLITRKNNPYQGMYALPGGIVDPGESDDHAAVREAEEETCTVVDVECLGWEYKTPGRDPRGRFETKVYKGKIIGGQIRGNDDAATAKLYPVREVITWLGKNKFAFDHEEIITRYFRMRGYL